MNTPKAPGRVARFACREIAVIVVTAQTTLAVDLTETARPYHRKKESPHIPALVL